MRFAFVAPEEMPADSLRGASGGLTAVTMAFSRALVEAGHGVDVLTRASALGPEQDEPLAGLRIKRCLPRGARSLGWVQRWRTVARVLGDSPYSLVELPDYYAPGVLVRGGPPCVVRLHTTLGMLFRLRDERIVRFARIVEVAERRELRRHPWVYATDFSASSTQRVLGIQRPPRSRRVLPLVLPPDPVADYPLPTARYVLFAARTDPNKGIGTMLRAWAKLWSRRRDCMLVVAGRDSGRLGDVTGVDDGVLFLGEVARPALWRLYETATAAIIASRYEAASMSGLEAVVAGAPLICTRGHGISELIRPSDALWFDAGDDAQLCDLLDVACSEDLSVMASTASAYAGTEYVGEAARRRYVDEMLQLASDVGDKTE